MSLLLWHKMVVVCKGIFRGVFWFWKPPLKFLSSIRDQRTNASSSAGEKPEGSLNVHPNNQLRGSHCATFVAMFHSLHSIKNE